MSRNIGLVIGVVVGVLAHAWFYSEHGPLLDIGSAMINRAAGSGLFVGAAVALGMIAELLIRKLRRERADQSSSERAEVRP